MKVPISPNISIQNVTLSDSKSKTKRIPLKFREVSSPKVQHQENILVICNFNID